MLSTRQCYTLALITLVITSSFLPCTEAGRIKSSSRKTSSGSSSRTKPRPPTNNNQNRAPNQANTALSYGQVSAPRPVQNTPPKAPSAPAAPAGWNTNAQAPAQQPVNSRPIGWNVNNNNNNQAGAGGIQKSTATNNNNAPPAYNPNPGYNNNPPPYSAGHPNGPPPAYSPAGTYQQPHGQYPVGQNNYQQGGAHPPAYSPNGHGYPQQNYPQGGGYGGQQPNYHQPGQVGYPQQSYGNNQGGFGNNNHYPGNQGGYGGGYGGQQPVINNYYGQKSSGGLGLTNALLLGVGGIALYGALKPGETKTIYVNNSTNPEDARQVSTNGTHVLVSDNNNQKTVATPLAPFPDHCAQYMNQPVPLAPFPEQPVAAAAMSPPQAQQMPMESVPLAPLAPVPAQQMPMESVPLAPLPEEPVPLAVMVETTTTSSSNETVTTTEAVLETTTAVPLAPLPESSANANNATIAVADGTNSNASNMTIANQSQQPPQMQAQQQQMPVQQPQIPSECLPFVTGQVLPTNYTGPPPGAAYSQGPNPNIQYGNPQWQQNYNPNQQQQQWNAVPVEGVQQKASSGNYVGGSAGGLVAMVVGVMALVMGQKRFL